MAIGDVLLVVVEQDPDWSMGNRAESSVGLVVWRVVSAMQWMLCMFTELVVVHAESLWSSSFIAFVPDVLISGLWMPFADWLPDNFQETFLVRKLSNCSGARLGRAPELRSRVRSTFRATGRRSVWGRYKCLLSKCRRCGDCRQGKARCLSVSGFWGSMQLLQCCFWLPSLFLFQSVSCSWWLHYLFAYLWDAALGSFCAWKGGLKFRAVTSKFFISVTS